MGHKKCPECDSGLITTGAKARRCLECSRAKFKSVGELKVGLHGITIEQYNAMVDSQGGGCKICGDHQDRFDIDHDHSCCPGAYSCGKCVRGLLCRRCNVGLGMFRESIEALKAAIRYLEDQ